MALSMRTQIVLGVLLAGSVAAMVLSDEGDGVLEYVYVDKVFASPEDFKDREFRVHGRVVEGSVSRKKNDASEYRFVIEYAGKRLDVVYSGIVPDTFQEKGEVVLTGRLKNDRFESHEMSAKCPSKYEAEDGVVQTDKKMIPAAS